MVSVEVSGSGELRAITIRREAVDLDDVGMLEDLVPAAVTGGLRQAYAVQEQKMDAVARGINLGPLGGLLG